MFVLTLSGIQKYLNPYKFGKQTENSLIRKTEANNNIFFRHCGGASYIMKIDDDIQGNFDNVRSSLDTKFPNGNENIVACNGIMRNMRPWRHNHTNTVMGKWSIEK
jgi:hypothetical protein